jgi:hypothetical protein
MCSGPKSAWKALYNKCLSTEKYTGGSEGVAAVVVDWDLAERLDGDLLDDLFV